jgi:hypothetical protein
MFAPSSARRNFFKRAPHNLKSWIRPWAPGSAPASKSRLVQLRIYSSYTKTCFSLGVTCYFSRMTYFWSFVLFRCYDFIRSLYYFWTIPKTSPLGNWKTWFFGVKSWFFTRNTPTIFAPPSARRNFFKCFKYDKTDNSYQP